MSDNIECINYKYEYVDVAHDSSCPFDTGYSVYSNPVELSNVQSEMVEVDWWNIINFVGEHNPNVWPSQESTQSSSPDSPQWSTLNVVFVEWGWANLG